MRVRKNSNKGFTLALLIIVVAILIVIGLALLGISNTEFLQSVRSENRMQALYIARSGAESVYSYINEQSNSLAEVNDLITENIDPNNGRWTEFPSGNPEGFKVWMGGDNYYPIIYSTGKYHGIERTISVELEKTNLFDSTVNVSNLLVLGNSSGEYVNGDVTLFEPAMVELTSGETTLEQAAERLSEGSTIYERDPLDFLSESEWNDLFPSSSTGWGEMEDFEFFDLLDEYVDPDPDYEIEINGPTNEYIKDFVLGDGGYGTWMRVRGEGVLRLYVDTVSLKGKLTAEEGAEVYLFVKGDGNPSTVDCEIKTPSPGEDNEFQGFILAPYETVILKASVSGLGGLFADTAEIESGATISPSGILPVTPEDLGFDSLGYHILTWHSD